MNCTACNTPAAPHELIGGLCHRCTAALLEEYKRAKEGAVSKYVLRHTAEDIVAHLQSRLDESEAGAARLREALENLKCPGCDGSGAINHGSSGEGEENLEYCSKNCQGRFYEVHAALAIGAGQGWLSPQEAAMLRQTIRDREQRELEAAAECDRLKNDNRELAIKLGSIGLPPQERAELESGKRAAERERDAAIARADAIRAEAARWKAVAKKSQSVAVLRFQEEAKVFNALADRKDQLEAELKQLREDVDEYVRLKRIAEDLHSATYRERLDSTRGRQE